MKLTVLGCMGGYPSQDTGTSAYLLESEGYHLLIDAGSGSLLALQQFLDPLELDAVLISHYHYDHIADLGVLQQIRKLKRFDHAERRAPLLPIYAHTDSDFFSLLSESNVTIGISYEEEESLSVGPFEVEHLKTRHPATCYAFRITERETGKTLVYTADSGFMEELIPFSQQADFLVADTNFFAGMENHSAHMTAGEVGRIAREAQVKKVMLSHLPHSGNLKDLIREAEVEAPETEIILAEKDMRIIIE